LLYNKKDYEAECKYLQRIFRDYAEFPIKTVLDLGCGTGKHCFILNKMGYRINGVDISPNMIAIAKKKAKDGICPIDFTVGDIRTVLLHRQFDAAISMFSVIGYQNSQKDITATFMNVARHLKAGGLFIFDCWHGPAVLHQKPAQKFKIIEDGSNQIMRFVSPLLDPSMRIVEVTFKIMNIQRNRLVDDVIEIHRVRYFFLNELKIFCQRAGFLILETTPFMKRHRKPGIEDWNITVVARKRR